MVNSKDDAYYVAKILKDLDFLISHTQGLTELTFGKDEVLLDSILFRLIQISENIKKFTPEFIIKNPRIPWVKISGFRNRIVHEYGNVDLSVIFATVSRDIYELRDLFSKTGK